MLAGLVCATLFAWVAGGQTPGTPFSSLRMVGAVAVPWPRFSVPQINWASVSELFGLAFALTIVALGQSISIAKAVAARSGQRIDANREFRGQGLSNMVGGFFPLMCLVAR
jgi:SulP family sulfate permease